MAVSIKRTHAIAPDVLHCFVFICNNDVRCEMQEYSVIGIHTLAACVAVSSLSVHLQPSALLLWESSIVFLSGIFQVVFCCGVSPVPAICMHIHILLSFQFSFEHHASSACCFTQSKGGIGIMVFLI